MGDLLIQKSMKCLGSVIKGPMRHTTKLELWHLDQLNEIGRINTQGRNNYIA